MIYEASFRGEGKKLRRKSFDDPVDAKSSNDDDHDDINRDRVALMYRMTNRFSMIFHAPHSVETLELQNSQATNSLLH